MLENGIAGGTLVWQIGQMNFHKLIVSAICDLLTDGLQLLLDPICGGRSNLQLFRSASRSCATRYAQPDGLFTRTGRVVGGLEIEDAGEYVGPDRLSENFFKVTMCHSYLPSDATAAAMVLADLVFVQIVNSTNWPRGSSKTLQFKNLEEDINAHHPERGSISNYYLITGTIEDFAHGAPRERLRQIVSSLNRTQIEAAEHRP
jgi:hypothetical protein